jgi:hypothetical protein
MSGRYVGCAIVLIGSIVALAPQMQGSDTDPVSAEELLKKADDEFSKNNYKDANAAYSAFLKAAPEHEDWRRADKRIITCKLRLQLYDDALAAATAHIKRSKDTSYEARAERLAGNLWMTVPHWGTRAGGEFHRAQWKQGIRLDSHRHDKKQALAHMARARELYSSYDVAGGPAGLPEKDRKNWRSERIECLFDLAAIHARFGIYENSYMFWFSFWGERDEFRAETAGEDDFDEQRNHWELTRKRPIGLRIGPDSKPVFPGKPETYEGEHSDDQKILYLFDEIRGLDETDDLHYAAMSYYRQAMLARSRFGMDRLNQYASTYWSGTGQPLKGELETFNPWELGERESLVLAGGRIRKVELPAEWDILSNLRVVSGDYRRSGLADQAHYAVGLYYQTRQQYITALKEYESLRKQFPSGKWASSANRQIGKIKRPQISISPSQVQLPGGDVRVQISYRNLSNVWFAARRIDLLGFMNEARNEKFNPVRGPQGRYALQNWHQYFVHAYHDDWARKTAAKYIGPEITRWSDRVADDGTRRYAQANLPLAVKEPGAYLVQGFVGQPAADTKLKSGKEAMALGDGRAIVVLTDLALVEKQVKDGILYWISDARDGSPVPSAKIDVQEVWSTWDKKTRKHTWHKRFHKLTADEDGLAVLNRDRNNRGQLHVLTTAGEDRIAWSGMSYWRNYNPSSMRSGRMAYCITDRPVYRPNQTVNMKVWVRQMQEGTPVNLPNRSVGVTVYDPKGNKVHQFAKRTDEFGGVDSQFALADEPPLGVYRIQVQGHNITSGQNFRVEEYKKPEFDVSVEPGKNHAKLGETITAVIKANYFFGAPVADATVSYKVFREEYRHRHYFPGRWDWLYGPAYGWPWYEYPWMNWWPAVRSCWAPPGWWGGRGGGGLSNPVRELVDEGEAPIGEDGTLELTIETVAALRDHPDMDHQYVIQADVRDSSRRVISGEGAVKATRQAYYAFVQPDRGYYRPGEEMRIRIRCLTPDNNPVKASGVITVSEVVYGGPDNARMEETVIKEWRESAGDDGGIEFLLRHEKSGLLKIKFATPDEWGGIVEGYGLAWVCGRDFNGKLYRFNDLEIISDKRSYQPGEVAHVMINTRKPNSSVLFSDQVDNNHLLKWRMLRLPNKHTVIDIPITKQHHPNFFVEATTVADARVSQQAMQICVPPEKGVMDVDISSDKPEYGPGDKARIRITAKTYNGRPAKGQFVVSAFDKSVLYIQPEYSGSIAKFFHGNVRRHSLQMQTNLLEQFSAYGNVQRPFQDLYPLPESWNGVWGARVGDWRTVSEEQFADFAIAGSGAMAKKSNSRMRGVGRAMAQSEMSADAAMAPAAPAEMKERRDAAAEPALVEAEVRKSFADTALWLATLTTDEKGEATAEFQMPENLTTWKINTWGMTKETRVGQSDTSVVTTKNLLVRLQAPRFFMEYDEVVISANVHNYLDDAKTARVSLEIPSDRLKMIEGADATTDILVPAGGEARVDWRVKVLSEGTAAITVKALTDEESDAMQMSFPVLVHGMFKQVASTGSMRPGETDKTVTVELDVPDQRRPELTRLEVQFAPSLVGAMIDALPYCITYPYGCTEQTTSRFLGAVLTLKTIQNMGIRLEDVRNVRGRMAEVRRIEKGEQRTIYADSPIFDEDELNKMIEKGISRLAAMQHRDGGWGWWKDGSSSPYMTGYVLYGLCTAQQCDVKVDENTIQRGMNYLQTWHQQDMQRSTWSPHAQHAQAAYVLSLKKRRAAYSPPAKDKRPGDLIERLWLQRDKLGLYGKALLAMAMANSGEAEKADTVLENILQYKEENRETQVAWFRTPSRGWWYWWNSDIEANAMVLRAIVRLRPKSDVAPRLVKWLLNNRRNGYYWRSTRDTTLCVAAMSDFVVASGEGKPNYTLTLDLDDGAVVKTVKIDKDNFFSFDNRFIVDGKALSGGAHTLRVSKDGPGALYFNVYLRYFTKEENIKAAGHELKIDRTYFKLERVPYQVKVEGSKGQELSERRLRYKRVELQSGDELKSGDVVQVELKVSSDNDYTYLCFEDMKPAGCEAVEIRSGGQGQEGFYSYMELRDEKTAFFVNSLSQGDHLLRYRLRAEIPGEFHALPSKVYAMYVPELVANGDEHIVRIVD